MKIDYEIDSLIKIFQIHAEEYEKECGSKQQPTDFNLSRALEVICKEIRELKNEEGF